MTSDELDLETRDLIAEIGSVAPGRRHHHLGRLHDVMASYSRAGRAAPIALRRLLEEMTEERVEAQFDNMPV
jgi:hypothetical protein